MKSSILVLFTVAIVTASASAQGSLTPPPGAPAPVMKSLDQIEARTPLVAGQPGVVISPTGEMTITADGSYYLTGNLTSTNTAVSCINLGTYNVTLDLNGFTVKRTVGTVTDTAGILIAGASRQTVMIRNGFIVGAGTAAGFLGAIDTTSATEGSVHVEDLHCSNVRNGIILNYDESRNSVRGCSVENCGGVGIAAEIVTDCCVRDTMSVGIVGSTVTGCTVRQSSNLFPGNGIGNVYSGLKPVVTNCHSSTTSGIAIVGSVVTNCYANCATGSSALNATLATNCVAGRNTAGTTISAITANGCTTTYGTNVISNKYNMP